MLHVHSPFLTTWQLQAERGDEGWKGGHQIKLEMQGGTLGGDRAIGEARWRRGTDSHIAWTVVVFGAGSSGCGYKNYNN